MSKKDQYRGLVPFKKGQSGNPKGRPPVILPEVRALTDEKRNAWKVLIVQKLDPKLSDWLDQIIAQGMEDGDAVKLKMLMEMVVGKIPEDAPKDELSPVERKIIEVFRDKVAKQNGDTGSIHTGPSVDRGSNESSS
jgi:hypothetical protein